MPRSQGTTVYNSFVNGLVTEATGLNFPENAVTDADNCIFDKTGIVYRRPGMDYEVSYETDSLDSQGVHCSFLWENAGTDGDTSFIVVQVGRYVRFWSYSETDPVSPGFKTFSIDLTSYKSDASITTQQMRENKVSFSSGLGYLFLAHKYMEPLYVSYNSTTDAITIAEVTIYIRDFEGIDDGLDTDERPSTLSYAHEYNLQNQGWNGPIQAIGGSSEDDPLGYWDSAMSNWPSNADVWFLYKNANEIMTSVAINSIGVGNSPASKGHFVYNAFDISRDIIHSNYSFTPYGSLYATFPGTYTVETQSTNLRPQFTEFYAGRVWWTGVQDGEFSSRVYFSKVIEGPKDFGVCHMVNDPTSEYQNDLLPTDGGVIKIPETTRILLMKAVGDSILVFATNGVWSISGTATDAFTADSFEVKKVSEIGGLSEYSFVSVDNVPIWWNENGIYSLELGPTGASVTPVSQERIDTFYQDIRLSSKRYAQGMWNKNERTVSWVYRSSSASSFEENFQYDKILVLNVDTRAFYHHTIPNTGANKPKIKTCINTGYLDKYLTAAITTGTTADYTWSEMNTPSYRDWLSFDDTGTYFTSYFISGYKLRGQSLTNFQSNYVVFTSETLSGSSFFVSGRWDYANNEASNSFTTQQQGYKHDANRAYSQRKLKLRGNGKVLQYKVTSQDGYGFKIAGWATYDTVNTGV